MRLNFPKFQEVEQFYVRDQLEKRFLDFIDTRFRYVDKQLTPENVMDRKPLDTDVYTKDDFDYARLETPLLNESECRSLQVGVLCWTGCEHVALVGGEHCLSYVL